MTIHISGKNLDITKSFRSHIEDRTNEMLSKYFDRGFNVHVTIGKEGQGCRTECVIHLDTGVILHSKGDSHNAGSSFEEAFTHIEKRLRRYNRKLKDHNANDKSLSQVESESKTEIDVTESDEESSEEFAPMVVAESDVGIRILTVGMAAFELSRSGKTAIVFKNAGNGELNVVFRREDGNIGWIDPEFAK